MFIYLIFILIIYIENSLTVESGFQYLNENQIFEVKNNDQKYKLQIFCSSGQHISLSNALMSSYLHFKDGPKLIQVFSDQNHTKVAQHFSRRGWTSMSVTKWLDTSLVTNLMIPSFRYNCIGILSKDSYDLELIIQTIDLYRLVTLLIGLLLFNFGPKLSRSSLFYYTSCATIGTFASFLIIFIIIGRYFPRKLSALFIMLGSSAIVCAFRIFWESFQTFLIDNSFYVLIYGVVSALISVSLGYRFGPITNHKTLNLMQWFLQLIGLLLIGISSQIIEYSCIAILTTILWKLISIKQFFSFNFKQRKHQKIKFLTESEFELQSDVQTKKALEELKTYCMSSECNAWKVIGKLKDPIRFARFMNGENHISDNEIMVFENSESSHSMPFTEDIDSDCNHFNDILSIYSNNNETIEEMVQIEEQSKYSSNTSDQS